VKGDAGDHEPHPRRLDHAGDARGQVDDLPVTARPKAQHAAVDGHGSDPLHPAQAPEAPLADLEHRPVEALGGQVLLVGDYVLIETEEGFWADTGARSAALLRAVGHPALALNWDPANSFCEGDCPYPDGYAHVRALVRRLGGTIAVASELHRGTTFTITLPAKWSASNRDRES